jgi:hypothetical protein
METPTTDELGNTYLVAFQGCLIHCSTIQDALAIKRAGAALAGDCDAKTPEQFHCLAGVLRWYGLDVAADEMTALASRNPRVLLSS